MFFRNLFLYRFPVPCAFDDTHLLDDKLSEHALRPCGQLELSTSGFVDPQEGDPEPDFIVDHDGVALFCLGTETRLLPNDVVNRELAKEIHAREEFEQTKVGTKQRKHIREEIITKMLPQSFVRLTRTHAMLDLKEGWLIIDTASQKRAEDVVTHLRMALGSFQCVPMCPEESPRAFFTDWVIRGKLPAGLALGDSVVLRDPVENGAVVRCTHQDLETDEISEHLKSGKQVFEIALSYNDRVSFTLNESLVVRKFKMLDVAIEELEQTESELYATASFLLMAHEIKALLNWMAKTFGLPVAPALKLDGGDAPASMRDQAKLEKAVGVTKKMYDARATARDMLGDNYEPAMVIYKAKIKARVALTNQDLLPCVIEFAKKAEDDRTRLLILAAYVEMVEPSKQPAPLKRQVDKVIDNLAKTFNGKEPGVQKAAKKFVDGVRKGGASVTISMPSGKAVHISNDAVGDVDELFTKVLDHVRKKNLVSIANVQREFKLGYNRAARIVEQLEEHGHVSAPGHGGARTVTAQ